MAEYTFESGAVEEFYNSCHRKADGRFCGVAAKGKGVIRVPMSDAARRSNAILRAAHSARKSKEYKQAKKAINSSWARREHGQGGNVGTGRNSAKADRARVKNAAKGVQRKKVIKLAAKAANKITHKLGDHAPGPTKSALAETLKYATRRGK
jgi:hypothetical protein